MGRETEPVHRAPAAGAAYLGIFLVGALFTAAAILDLTPPFFIPGEGPTVIRQVVLTVSVTLLLTSALLMMAVYAERKTGFLLYSINALLLIAAGIVGVALGAPGSPLSWLGRASQYLGDVYLAVAAMKALGEARSKGTTVERALADYFRKAETHYRALVEMATDAIVACDREGRILLMNPAAEQTFGYGPGEAVNRILEELIVPEQSRDSFSACLSGESWKDVEMELARKDGTIFPAELSVSREMKYGAGATKTFIVRDITERKRADEALRESESRFRTLAGATFEGVAITENGRFTDINEQFCRISGYDRPELLGMDVSMLIHPDDRDRVLDNILSGLESAVVHRMFRKDGSPIRVEAHGKTVRHDGRDRRLTAVRDITEARKAEEAIQSAALFPIQNPEPVLRVNRYGILLFSNPAADPVLAEWRAESAGVIPVQIRQVVEAALNEGTPRDFEMHVAGRDFSFVVTPIVEGQYANLYGWDVTDRKRAEAALRDSEERYRGLFESMNEGFALHELLYDESGKPCDYRFLDVNPAFERQTGLKREDVVGKTVFEVLPGIEPLWIKRYGEVALTGAPAHFKSRSTALGRDYEVFAYRPAPGQFAVIFMDITDRLQAEESLRASYDLLRIAQRAANAGIWGWTMSTGKFTWSEELYTLFGLDPAASASFETWLGVMHPDDRQPAMERIHRSIREGTPLENEYRIIRPDGQQRWIRAWGSTLYDESGQPLSMSCICIDTTASKRAEESLQAIELRMKAVADHLPVGVWFADETGKIVYGNEAGRQIWAGARYVDPEEFHVYRAWWSETGQPLGPEDWAVVRAVKKGETSLKEVLEIECFDGARKTILNSAVPLKSGDGRISGVVVLNEDITERIEAEQALRRSEARYRSYIEVTGQMGWATNADGEVVEDLPALRQYTGQTFHEMRGRGWSKALHPDDAEITLAVWQKAVEEKQGYETEYRLRRHDGVYRHFLARGVPILNDDGSVREWVGTCIDITERRRQVEELRKLNRTLRALSRSNEALMRAEEELAFLEEVCRIVVQDCGYAMVWIGYAYDDEDRTVRPVAHAGFSEGYLETLTLTWADREQGRGPTGTSIRTGKPILCTDMLTDPRFEPWRDEALKRGYASSLAIPLLGAGRAFGAVTIYSIQPDSFSEEEIKLLSEMADDLTYGITSLRLRLQSRQTLQALQESEARFRLLSDTAGRLLATDDAQDLIEKLCRDVMEHLDCQAFFNFMVDESAGRLHLNACAGIPEEEVRKLEWLDYGVAVCGCVSRDKARIIAEDIFHTPDVRTELVRSYGIQAYCCHPLKDQDRLIGTLSFGTKTRARFTPEEVELMRIVADQVAIAMERIRAQQEIRKSAEELRLANEQLEQRIRERTAELMLTLEDLEKNRGDLRKLAAELVLAEERERKRISVVLHDEVAQTLAATKMRLDLLRSLTGGAEFRIAISEAQELLGQSIRQTRALMTDISNPVLYDMGLRVAVEALAEEVKARHGISVSCSFGGKLRNLGQDMEVMIFQVVKELVQNIVKHSRARNASIRVVEEKDAIRAVVTDDGLGFETGHIGIVRSEGGFGLFSIRERVKSYGGRIHIKSEPGRGSEVTVKLPKAAAGNTAPLMTRNGKKGD